MKPRDLRPWREGAFDPQSLPPTLRVLAEPGQIPTAEQVIGVKRAYHAFRDVVRTSIVDTMRKHFTLPDGTQVMMTHEFGRDHLEVRLPPERLPEPSDFFGGLVLRFERLNEAGQAYLEDHSYGQFPEPEQRETIPFTLTGPSAVPGSLGQGATEWLVLQIARTGDLANDPVRNGVVKLHRIANPLIGNIASHAYGTRRYILTADWSNVGPEYRVSNFYLCGRNIGIPQTPVFAEPYSVDMVRMYTFGFRVKNFAQPLPITGTIILVWWGRILVYRTGGAWETVAEIPVSGAAISNGTLQPYGYDFTLESEGGTPVLTCSGSNAEGECSNFEVRMGATVTGSIELLTREQFTAPPNPASTVTSIEADWSNSIDAAAPVLIDGGPGFNDNWRFTDGCFKQTTLAIADGGVFAGGAAAERDPFVGGVLIPATQARSYELTASRTTGQTNVDEYIYEYVVNGLGADVAIPHFGYDQPYSAAASITLTNTTLGNITFNFSSTSSGALDTSVVNGSIGGPVGVVSTNHGDRTWSATFPMSGTASKMVVREYSAMDLHRKRLAWRHDATRTLAWEAELFAPGQAEGTISGDASAPAYSARLVDNTLATRAERTDFLGTFNGLVTYGGTYTFDQVPSFCSVPNAINDEPTRPQGATFVPLLNTKIDKGTISSLGIAGFWQDIYLDHFNGLGTFHTNETVPEDTGPPPHDNVFEPDEGNWAADFDGNAIPTFNVAGYESMGDITVDPVPGYWTGTLPLLSRLNLPDDLGNYYQAPFERPQVTAVDDRVYVDPRTDGYVAQSFWDGEMESGGDIHPSIQTIIGNDESTTTLEAVLNEAAGLRGMFDEYTRVFIRQEVAKDVALI